MILAFAGGCAGCGGGGGGTRVAEEVEDWFRVCDGMLIGVGTGVGVGVGVGFGTARGVAAAAAFPAPGRGWGVLLTGTLDDLPLGPPGLISLPLVMGLGGTGLAFGIGFEAEFGDSPGCVCTAPLL